MKIKSIWFSILVISLCFQGAYSPVIAAGALIKAEKLPNGEIQSSDLSARTPLNGDYEIHVVTGYETQMGNPQIKVQVDRPGKSIVLILSSYHKAYWFIEPTAGTTIAEVFVSGYEESKVFSEQSFPVFNCKLNELVETENINFEIMLDFVASTYGRDHITSFFGIYALPSEIRVNRDDSRKPELSRAFPPAEKSPVSFEFLLPITNPDWRHGPKIVVSKHFVTVFSSYLNDVTETEYINFRNILDFVAFTYGLDRIVSFFDASTLAGWQFALQDGLTTQIWTPEGPKALLLSEKPMEQNRLKNINVTSPNTTAQTPDGELKFKIGQDQLIVIDMKSGETKNYDLAPNFPRFSWVSGIAYIPDLNIVALSGLSFYRFDVAKREWRDFRELGWGSSVDSLAYDPYTKHLIGVSSLGECRFKEFTTDGEPLLDLDLSTHLPGLKRCHDNGPCIPLSVVPFQQYVAFLAFPQITTPPVTNTMKLGSVYRIWVLDRTTGKGVLTYRTKSGSR